MLLTCAAAVAENQLCVVPCLGALPQRRVPVTYAGKQATTPPPAAAASRSKRSLIGSSSSNHNHHHHAAAAGGGVVDAEALEHLQEEVGG